MDREAIKNILPHREGMLLLDEVTKEGEVAKGKFKVKGDEWFLQGHFPGEPVMPGVIQCEILAQSVCVLLQDVIEDDKLPVYTGLNNVKFRSPVVPGDVFETECEITRSKHPFYFAKGKGYVDGKLCVQAEFSFAITERK